MDMLTANEVKKNLCDMLLNTQGNPIYINKHGKTVAVVISAEEYESIESLKSQLLQSKYMQIDNISANNLVDGSTFFDDIDA
jgi:prevent-host-death family protein